MHMFKQVHTKGLVGVLILSLTLLTAGCGGQEKSGSEDSKANEDDSKTELTDFQMENGIGPVTEQVELGDELDPELIEKGEQMFELKCSACHKLDSRYVGPPLASITNTRSPAYIMNMILNPAEMIEKHPIPRGLLGNYATRMTDQHLSREEARAVVEYLASEDRKE